MKQKTERRSADDIFFGESSLISWIFSEIYETTFSFELNLKSRRERGKSLHTIENFHVRSGKEIRWGIKKFSAHTTHFASSCEMQCCVLVKDKMLLLRYHDIFRKYHPQHTTGVVDAVIIILFIMIWALDVVSMTTLFRFNCYLVRWDQKWKVVAFITKHHNSCSPRVRGVKICVKFVS